MTTNHKTPFLVSALILTTIICFIFIAGCTLPTSGTDKATSAPTPVAPVSPAAESAGAMDETSVVQPVSMDTVQTAGPTPTRTQVPFLTYTNPSYGLTIPYPADWEYEEPNQLAMRDYGRTTLNIVNFFTPTTPYYSVFSVDVDPSGYTDDERYFNLAVLAHQEYYPSRWEMTKHNFQWGISDRPAYRLDFMVRSITHADHTLGMQVYTFVDSTPYIFTFKGPEGNFKEYLDEAMEMMGGTTIMRNGGTGKSR